MKASKGVRMLAVLLGSIGSMAWITFVMVVSRGFAEVEAPWGWVFLVVLAGIFFLIPFLLVHGTAWVIRGS
jgi:predicted histidine transporter YuiF (NhaC family)